MKKFIVRFGYFDYAIEHTDAVALLDIAGRARVVKRVGYTGPYYVQPDQEPFVDAVSLQEVVDQESAEEPDKFSAATRDVAPF
jgi:imidazoleglycerol phosphate dehydratase HisB